MPGRAGKESAAMAVTSERARETRGHVGLINRTSIMIITEVFKLAGRYVRTNQFA